MLFRSPETATPTSAPVSGSTTAKQTTETLKNKKRGRSGRKPEAKTSNDGLPAGNKSKGTDEKKDPIPESSSKSNEKKAAKKPESADNKDTTKPNQVKSFRTEKGLKNIVNASNLPKSFLSQFPDIIVSDNATENLHAVLHMSRFLYTQDVVNRMSSKHHVKSLLDVGGTPCRTQPICQKYGMSYHSCNPMVTAQDAARKALQPPRFNSFSCAHTGQSCDCGTFDAALFVHSAYYFEPQEIARLILKTNRRIGYMITHIFEGASGHLPNIPKHTEEARWSREQGQIVMSVNGNSFDYVHKEDMTWLRQQTGIHFHVAGKAYTMSWTLQTEIGGTLVYSFVVAEGKLVLDRTFTPVAPINLSEFTMTALRIESFDTKPGFLNLFTRAGRDVRIYEPLYTRLKLQMIGKFPSKATYTTLAQTLKRIVLTENEKLTKEEWFVTGLSMTLAVAYLQACVENNHSQKILMESSSLLEQMDYCNFVERQYDTSYWGQLRQVTSDWAARCGLETPYRACETLVTKTVPVTPAGKVFNSVMDTGTSITSTLLFDTAPNVALRVGNSLFPAVTSAFVKSVEDLREKAIREQRIVEILNGHPVRYEVDPDFVQKELNERVAAISDIAAIKEKVKTWPSKTTIEVCSEAEGGSFKFINPVVIEPNKPILSKIPYVVSAYHGCSNAPSSSDATVYSAVINRLYDGCEHSTPSQHAVWLDAIKSTHRTGFFPTSDEVNHYISEHPVLEPMDWLKTEYGRRDDKEAVRRYAEGFEKDDGMNYSCEFFVKDEPALTKGDDNKGRGIFVPNASWAVRASPTVYRAHGIMKLHNQFDNENRSVPFFPIGGSDAKRMADWRQSVEDHFGEACFAVEIDMTAYEANQTYEQVAETLKLVGDLTVANKRVRKLLDLQLRLKVVQLRRKDRSTIIFERDGGVASGVPNVTFTNSVNNIIAIVGYCTHAGMKVSQIIELIRACYLGDDNLLYICNSMRKFFDSKDMIDFYLEQYNWQVKVQIYDSEELHLAEVCSCRFQKHKDGWVYSPKAGRVMSKMFSLHPRLPDHPVIMRGMIRGLGSCRNSFVLSKMLNILDDSLARQRIALPDKEVRFEWSVNPHISSAEITTCDDIDGDCLVYGVGENEMRAFLADFEDRVIASSFPYGPVIIPRCVVWDRICNVDHPRSFVLDNRMDLSLPNRHLPFIMLYLYYVSVRKTQKFGKSVVRRLKAAKLAVSLLGVASPHDDHDSI